MSADRIDALNDDERALYDAVPADGTAITNPALRSALGWTADGDEDLISLLATQSRMRD